MQLGLYLLFGFVTVVFVACTVHTTWQDNLTGTRDILIGDYIKVLVQYVVIIGSVSVPWPLFGVQQWLQAVDIFVTLGSGQAFSLDCWLRHYFPSSKLPIAIQRHLVYFLAPLCTLIGVMALQCLVWAFKRWVVPPVASEGTSTRSGCTQPLAVVQVACHLPGPCVFVPDPFAGVAQLFCLPRHRQAGDCQ